MDRLRAFDKVILNRIFQKIVVYTVCIQGLIIIAMLMR